MADRGQVLPEIGEKSWSQLGVLHAFRVLPARRFVCVTVLAVRNETWM